MVLVASLSFALLISSLGFQVLERRARNARFSGLTLKPNCLLTRFPIVFISGPRTVFRIFEHWNSVPLYLREHGYEVYVVEPTGRTTEERAASTVAALSELGRCHVIADGSLESELHTIARLRLPNLSSLTCVKAPDRERFLKSSGLTIDQLRPSVVQTFEMNGTPVHDPASAIRLFLLAAHNFLIKRRTQFVHPFEIAELSREFSSERRFLDLAISLAEKDLVGSD